VTRNKSIAITVFSFVLLLVLSGCGDSPSEIPPKPLNLGDAAISVSVRMSSDSMFIPDRIHLVMDGDFNEFNSYIANPDTLWAINAEEYEFRFDFPVGDLVTARHEFMGEVIFDQMTSFPIDLEAGDIVVSVGVAPDNSKSPDSINVVLDSDTLGFNSNPLILQGVLTGSHVIRIWFNLDGMKVTTPPNTVEVEFHQISESYNEVRTGSMRITGSIELPDGSTITPDSVAIIIDGNNRGYYPNPAIMNIIPEGEHTITVHTKWQDADYVGPEEDITVEFNTTTDVDITLSTGGVVIVNAISNGAEVDSFRIVFDNNDFGLDESPRTLSNISAGSYQLQVWFHDDTVETVGWEPSIAVVSSETTRVEIEMGPVSPFVGNFAPNIECTDFNGANHSSLDHLGEVIYFYFFSGT